MNYWLMKSEPAVYPWSQLLREKRTGWNGVRNYQANNNMKAMRLGDLAFFYHSNDERSIVGIMKVAGLWHLDPEDEKRLFGMVDVVPVQTLKNPVSLTVIKAHPQLSKMIMIRQSRLSVTPVASDQWDEIIRLSDHHK